MSKSRGTVGPLSLDDGHYEEFVRTTETYRERLVVRLAGEAGLRPVEMTRIRMADVSARVAGGRVHYFLAVRDGAGGQCRTAYLPTGLKRELERYAASEGVGEGDQVLDVTARRLQMLVAEAADRAAAATGLDALADVSTADLRQHFGRQLLADGVDPSVVMQVGGWSRLEGLAPDVAAADPVAIAEAFARAGDHGDDRFRAAFERLNHAAALLDADGAVEHVNRQFVATVRFSDADVVGRDVTDLLGLSSRERTEMWETTLSGNTWVARTTWHPADGEPVRGQSTLTAIGTEEGSADGFVLTFRPAGTTVHAEHASRERLLRVQNVSSAVNETIADAGTREEVLALACERLAESRAFEFAWGTGTLPDGSTAPLVWVDIEEADIDRLAGDDTEAGARVPDNAIETGTVRTTWVEHGGTRYCLIAVPLVHGESVDGALVLGSTQAPSQPERAALANLGGGVAGALAAMEWKRLLLADTVLELEFHSDDRESFFVAASADLDCELRMEGLVPLGGEALLYYVTVTGVPPDRALATASESLASARLIAAHEDECLLEVTADGDSLAGALIDQGTNVSELSAKGGEAHITCETTPTAPVRAVAEYLKQTTPTASLVAKREVEARVRTPTEYQRSLEGLLTEKQLSVLRAAYHAGYFDWPRGSTAEELADSIDVSSPTLHNHLRRGQRKLLAAFFEDG
jgi:PAS domain S-box-containing protein